MKPITTMRLRFIAKKMPNAQFRTPNVECRNHSSEFGIRRCALDVGRLLRSLECLHHRCGITSDDAIRGHAFRHHRAGSDDGIFADGDTLQDDRIHSDPNVIENFHRARFEFGAGWAIFVKWRNGLSIDESLRRLERMKIRVGDPDVPRDQTVRSDFNSFVRHDKRAVEQGKIANNGRTIYTQGKGTACVNRNMIAQTECVRLFRFHEAKHLRGFAIKPIPKIDIRRYRMRTPIAFPYSL